MNGSYYTQKLVLKTGTYKLTEFVLIDASGNTIYAAPLAGSQEAQNVTNPLPITFTVEKNISSPVNVQVLSTAAHTPEDFGLSHFPVTEIKTLSFMIGVIDNSSDDILPATLTVSNGAYTYVQNLDSVLNNVVTVTDGLPDYTLTVEHTGFITFTHTYTIDSLKIFEDAAGNLPLLVELEKAIDQYTLSVGKAGTGTGLVTSSPAGINCGVDCSEPYNFGNVVTLTATPDAGSTFAGWSGGGCSGTGTCQVTMNNAVSVTATFTAAPIVPEVTNPTTGKIWMDRNLGATQVATSSTDAAAYGDLYQWGRGTDGHQLRTSTNTSSSSSTDIPGNANFILGFSYTSYDWRSPQNASLWQGVNGVNNPCPTGFRIPTDTELDAERASWSSNNLAGAFASPLKFTTTGIRNLSNGSIMVVTDGYYWSNTVVSSNSNFLRIQSGNAYMDINNRGYGMAVRCIKD
ncbi:MAG TPA: hypothetical protein VMV47_17415 [Bacteroidales bacterium]|nr:hypothetical protein [Bacteroidales bacterium]